MVLNNNVNVNGVNVNGVNVNGSSRIIERLIRKRTTINNNNTSTSTSTSTTTSTRYYIFFAFIFIGIIFQFQFQFQFQFSYSPSPSPSSSSSSVSVYNNNNNNKDKDNKQQQQQQQQQQQHNDIDIDIDIDMPTISISNSNSNTIRGGRGGGAAAGAAAGVVTVTSSSSSSNSIISAGRERERDEDKDEDEVKDKDDTTIIIEKEQPAIEDDNDNNIKNENDNKNYNYNNNYNNNYYYNITYAEMNDPLLNILPSTYRRRRRNDNNDNNDNNNDADNNDNNNDNNSNDNNYDNNNDNNNNIPNWMKEYFDWHRIQIFKLNETNWNTDTIQTTYKYSTSPSTTNEDKDNPNITKTTKTNETISIPISTSISIPIPISISIPIPSSDKANTNKFLIIRCLNQDRCGGLSDRIKPLLMFIAIASHTKRILMIRWERPYPLEEYLIPNEINWTIPSYILEELKKDDYHINAKRGGKQNLVGMNISRTYFAGPYIQNLIRNDKHSIIEAGVQVDDGGARLYQCIVETMLYNNFNANANTNANTNANANANTSYKPQQSYKQYKKQQNQNQNQNKRHLFLFNYSMYKENYKHCSGKFGDKQFGHYLSDNGKESYKRIYHDFFQSMFKPSSKVQYLIDQKMKKSNLIPGQFIGSHYRSDYGPGEAERIGSDVISNSAITQVRCAARMRPGYPVYFAGDSQIAINAVYEDALVLKTKNKNITIITAVSDIDIDENNDGNDVQQKQQQQQRLASNISIPLHIEFDKGSVEDFYPVFVDLLVMGNSMCQLYGIGGFGSFASLLSYNASCYYSTRTCTGSEEYYLPKSKCCMKELYENNAKTIKIREGRRKRKEEKEQAAANLTITSQ